MAKVLVSDQYLTNIAAAIRSLKEITTTFTPEEMATAISDITKRTSTDLTASGATVTVPAGYYSAQVSKAISSGSATAPASISGTSATLSTGTNTLTLTKSISVTPSVSAGYISTGTAGNSSVSLTASVTTKAAATITPSETAQEIAAGQYLTGKQTISAIPSTYVGSSITARSSSDLTVSGATVTAPAGYYASAASKAVASMTLPTAAATSATSGFTSKATIGRSTSAQYINIPTGYNAAGVYYTISATPNGSATTPATSITANPTISVDTTTGKITASVSGSKSVTPTVSTGYVSAGTAGTVSVSGSATSDLSTQAAATITPTETEQTAVAANKYTLGEIKVAAISSTYVGSGITSRSSTDLSASGATVTVPAGYYSAQASKSVSTMTLPTSAASSATSGYTSKATIGRSTSAQYINIPAGYNSAGGYYTISATPNGSATAPSSISGTSATLSTGTNTLTLTKTVSVTPTVSAGYVSAGTAGNSSVSLTASVTTKAAATYTPSETAQEIAADQYLTGKQTISAIPSTYVGSGITTRSSSDLTVSDKTVTVPAGYYASAASKEVPVIINSLSVTPSTITQTYNVGNIEEVLFSNKYLRDGDGTEYISLASYNLANGDTVRLTGNVGYETSGTPDEDALFANIDKTITLDGTTQTIIQDGSASKYVTISNTQITVRSGSTTVYRLNLYKVTGYCDGYGPVTVAGSENLIASNIKSGVSIFNVTGTLAFQTYYTGSSAPSSSLGSDGDIYLQS